MQEVPSNGGNGASVEHIDGPGSPKAVMERAMELAPDLQAVLVLAVASDGTMRLEGSAMNLGQACHAATFIQTWILSKVGAGTYDGHEEAPSG